MQKKERETSVGKYGIRKGRREDTGRELMGKRRRRQLRKDGHGKGKYLRG
jgi:hypothetical protein